MINSSLLTGPLKVFPIQKPLGTPSVFLITQSVSAKILWFLLSPAWCQAFFFTSCSERQSDWVDRARGQSAWHPDSGGSGWMEDSEPGPVYTISPLASFPHWGLMRPDEGPTRPRVFSLRAFFSPGGCNAAQGPGPAPGKLGLFPKKRGYLSSPVWEPHSLCLLFYTQIL